MHKFSLLVEVTSYMVVCNERQAIMQKCFPEPDVLKRQSDYQCKNNETMQHACARKECGLIEKKSYCAACQGMLK